jgi:hypothetical protein
MFIRKGFRIYKNSISHTERLSRRRREISNDECFNGFVILFVTNLDKYFF